MSFTSFSGPAASTPISTASFAPSQRIDQLDNTTLTNISVNGVSGLTAADIPTNVTAANYLPLSGGTLSGALSGTNLTLSGNLTVSGAQTLSGAVTIPYLTATSSTASSFLNASSSLLSVFITAYFGATATSTFDSTGFLTLPSGLRSQASSTIGNGARAGGLTISGGATTTGTAYFAGNIGIGSTSPATALSISGNAYLTGGLGVGVLNTQSGTINGWLPAWGVLSSNGGAPTTAGSSYAVGDTITLNAGCATNPTVSVASISGGSVADYVVQNTGSCLAIPGNPVGQLSTSGTGSGATFTLRWGPIAAALDEPSLFSGAGNFFLGGTLGTSEAAGHAAYGFENTFVGDKAGSMATGGSANTALGHNAYGSGAGVAVTGSYNTAIGDDAMRNATSTSGATIVGQAANHDGGVFNDATAMGAGALYGNANASGSNITAIGYQAMGSSSVRSLSNETCVGNQCLTNDLSGSGNTAIGHQAMQTATSSTNNTAVGAFALNKQTWGSANTAVGFFSLLNLTTGSNNLAAGEFALDTLTTGSSNTALGTNALNTTNGSGNVAVGNGAGQQSTGSENVFLGQSAGSGSGGSNRDTAIGNNALKTLTTGLGDIAIGWNTASTTTTGGQNIVIGYDIAPPAANGSNQLDIGNLIFGTGINGEGTNLSTGNIGIGTTSPDTLLSVGSATPVGNVAHFENSTGSCYINPTTTSLSCSSDARLKKNVVDIDASTTLEQLLALNPVLYNWNGEATGTPEHTGFIAQQVQPILPDLVSQGPDGYLTLNYAGFTPYLVKAVQDLATQINALVAAVANFAESFTSKEITATNELCVGSTCVTEAQFKAMVAAAGQSPSASASSSVSTSTAAPSTASSPIIEDATTSDSAGSDATSSLPALDPAPPLVPDYLATTTLPSDVEVASSTTQ